MWMITVISQFVSILSVSHASAATLKNENLVCCLFSLK